jgi:O-antigen/teichoic acid export membrane protein
MVDQGVSSLSNVVVSVLVARSLPTEGFGAFGLAVIAFLLVLGVTRALIGEPLLSQHSNATPEERRRLAPDMLGSAVLVGVVASAVVFVIGVVAGGAAGSALVALAIVLPMMMAQDTWRYVFIVDRPGAAVAVDVAWLVAVCVAMLLAPDHADPAWYVVAWGSAAGVGAVAGWIIARDSLAVPHPGRWFSDHQRMGSRFVGEFVTGTATTQLVLVGVGAIAGLAVLGAVRATQVFFGPVNTVHQGAYLALVPEGAQAASRPERMRRLMVGASIGLATVALLWMCVGLALPDRWGTALFGSTWSESTALLVPVGLAMVAGSLITGGFAGVRSLGAASDSLRARMRTVLPQLVLPIIGAALAAGEGYALGLAAAQLVSTIIWWSAFQRALARRTARATAAALASVAT